jgi:hypothetical protein
MGGTPTGGVPVGGAPTGGAPLGGAPTGGAPTGGASNPGGCLDHVGEVCDHCDDGNQGDITKCHEYITCFETEGCDPADSCATSNDGICGVNNVGGGTAPRDQARNTWEDCGCTF